MFSIFNPILSLCSGQTVLTKCILTTVTDFNAGAKESLDFTQY